MTGRTANDSLDTTAVTCIKGADAISSVSLSQFLRGSPLAGVDLDPGRDKSRASRDAFPPWSVMPACPKGTYALVLSCTTEQRIAIGRLGVLDVRPGCYVYVGSALGPGGY